MKTYHYILFDSHEQAVKLKKQLNDAGVRVRIAPTPRELTLCCGVSLMVEPTEAAAVQEYLDTHECVYKSFQEVQLSFNNKNDRYI